MSIFVVPTTGPIYSLRHPNEEIQTSQILKQISLEFLQLIYSENGPNTRYNWRPDVSASEILIIDKYSFNLDDVDTRPVIVANRGPLRWMSSTGFQQLQEYNVRTGQKISTDLISGSVTFNCFSKEGIEAEAIAGDVFEGFRVFREPLRKSGLFRIESTSMGEEALVKADTRPALSVVPVLVEASVQVRWSTEPYSRVLTSIVSSIGKVTTPVGSFNL